MWDWFAFALGTAAVLALLIPYALEIGPWWALFSFGVWPALIWVVGSR